MGSSRYCRRSAPAGWAPSTRRSSPTRSAWWGSKILHPKLANRKDLVSRFGREARALSQLSHPNTVKVFSYGELEDGSLYIIMELLEGKNLNQSVRAEGPFSVARALPILIKACGALEEAHKAGIIHRDLKPENIFLVQNASVRDFPKLLDFGLAKVGERHLRPGSVILTQEGMVFGTPEFMSPEQAQGKVLTPASDVYSLAVILYEVLTGKLPFDAKSAMDYIQLHVMGKPIPLNQRVAGKVFPPMLERIVDRALAKRPEERFASAEEFGRAMQSLLDGATELPPLVRVPPPTSAPMLARPPAPEPVPAGAFAPVPAPVFVPVAPPPPPPHAPAAIASPPPRPPAPTNSTKANIPLLIGVAVLFLLVGMALALGLLKLIAGR